MLKNIELAVGVKGEDLITAVEKIAIDLVKQEREVDGKRLFLIGQKGLNLHSHLVVLAGEKRLIDKAETYQQILVKEYCWGGMVFEIKADEKAVEQAIDSFTQQLEKILSSSSSASR